MMTIYTLVTLIIFSFLTNYWQNQITLVRENNTEFLVNIVDNLI